jgi:hypothetical protein
MAQLTLDSVQRDFELWRTSRTTGKTSKIPDHLWGKALHLLEHYSIASVMKALRLSGSQISAKRTARITNSKSNTAFVELNIPPLTPHANHGKVEIKRSDGTVLAIEQLTEHVLFQVLNNFMQKVH